MLFVGSAAAPRPLFCFCFPLFFGRSPFLGFIAFFATGLLVCFVFISPWTKELFLFQFPAHIWLIQAGWWDGGTSQHLSFLAFAS
jgi:hypothetical protein